MANEFIARKGLIALADSQITGSLNISQNIVAAGTVQATFASNTATAISGAFDAVSSSLASRITSQENFSSSLDSTFATDADLNLVSSSVDSLNAATSSYLQNTTDTLTGNLTVTGTLTAQDLHVQEITSSIVYSSGSNVFGENVSDTQTFTGSLQVSGSTNYLLGSVGIGQTSPNAKLEIYGTANSSPQTSNGGILKINSTATNAIIFGTLSGSPFGTYIQSGGSNTYPLLLNPNGGDVGIGTTSPSAKLHVDNSAADAIIRLTKGSSTIGNIDFVNEGNRFSIQDDGARRLVIDTNGNVGIGTADLTAKLHLYVNSANDDTFHIFNGSVRTHLLASESSNGVMYMRSSTNTNTVRLNASGFSYFNGGNVGIGTTSPGRKLTVTGDASGDANNLLLSNENDTDGDSASIGFSMLSNNTYVKSGIFFERTTTQGRGSLHLAVNNEVNGNNVSKSDAKLTINNSGKVGIGTNDPQSLLHASGSAQNILEIDSSDGDGPYAVYRTSGTAKGYVGSAAALANAGQSNFAVRAQSDLVFATGGATERMRIDSSGNVGIGTSPTVNFEVYKSSARLKLTDGTNQINMGLWDGSNYRFEGDSNRPMFFTSYQGNIYFGISGATTMTVRSGGVGIGTTDTPQALNVNGTIQATNAGAGYIQGAFVAHSSTSDTPSYRGQGYFTYNEDYDVSWYMGTPYTNGDFFCINRQHSTTSFDTAASYIGNTNTDNFFSINNSGSVGIGTTSMNNMLTIKCSSGSSKGLDIYHSNGNKVVELIHGGSGDEGQLKLYDSNVETVRIAGESNVASFINSGNIIIGSTAINGAFGVSNTILTVKGRSSGGEGILQLVGLSNNATDIPGRIEFHSQAEADPMCSIRATRGSADDIGDLSFLTNNGSVPQTRMRITSDGNVGINTTSPSVKFEVREGHSLLGGTQNNYGGNVFTTTLGGYGVLSTGTDRYGSYGWLTFNANNNYTGAARKFAFTNGYQTNKFALLIGGSGPTDPTLGSQGDISVGQLIFHVNNSADFMFGKVAGDGNGPHLQVNSYSYTSTFQGTSTSDMITVKTGTELNSNVGAIVFRDNGSDYCGQITVNGSTNTVQYLSASDYRLKEDFKDFNGIDLVDKINVYDFKWKKTDVRSYGVVAHELKEVLPLVVDGNKDEEKYQTVDYGKIVPILIKSIQELKAEIDALKNA